jgi:hypothetical protein
MNEALRTPLAAMRVDPSTMAEHNIPLCPKCHAVLNFCRSITPDIDSSGFESYRLDCQECGVALYGIIDPADDALIISECPSPANNP